MELFPHALQKAESDYLNFHNLVQYRLLKWEKAEKRAGEYSEASTALFLSICSKLFSLALSISKRH